MAIGLASRLGALERRVGGDHDDGHCWCVGYQRPVWWEESVALIQAGVPADEVVEGHRCRICGRLPLVLVAGGADVPGTVAITMKLGEHDLARDLEEPWAEDGA